MNQVAQEHGKGNTDHETGPDVHITVDGHNVTIHRGRQTVAAIKQAGGVPEGYVLVQDIDGRLEPLPDDGAVTLKGGEVFESHPRDGGAS